ncbi:acyl-CoA-binding domain-containing protein 5-like isoform X1 [Lingula anatina]|uniref:Acyl-CoA-binding domain-containing protein 5 n=2 Tax=Lingula anatina TaxID=7574 RepID=A0A1S3IIQ1_LINAN|nr:acyl-CoA-binding domain-containing protein 5-like isoform X1 [Lingula anatina]|eukprot:XP_013397384.1 acyl-CoA-binding domain-containing protein 5-like isoform X1 [Lingula anatina]
MATSAKEKFEAAVKVIQNLPKEGSFQPSHELMLKFYAYYKQATIGKCTHPRPAFWEVVKKAKWDAWNGLGDLSKEEAMLRYVEELKRIMLQQSSPWESMSEDEIIEAMPQTDNVTGFLDTLGNFYELVDEQLPAHAEKLRSVQKRTQAMDGDVVGESEPSSGSDASADSVIENSGGGEDNGDVVEEEEADVVKVPKIDQNENEHLPPSYKSDTDSEGEVYCDTSDQPDLETLAKIASKKSHSARRPLVSSSPLREKLNGFDTDFQPLPMSPIVSGQTDMLMGKNGPTDNHTHSNHQPQRTVLPGNSLENNGSLDFVGQLNHRGGEDEVDNQLEPLDALSARGGGETPTPSERGSRRHSRRGSGGSVSSNRGNPGHPQHPDVPGSYTYGSGGGGRDDRQYHVPYTDINDQIAAALNRLQQDMNSVLTRLNTLETLSIVQQQVRDRDDNTSRKPNQTSSWWPFPNFSGRTVMFLLVWPIIVHWVIRFLSGRRRRPTR